MSSPTQAVPRHYLPRSRVDARLEVRRSPVEGFGLFATAPISVGEVVIVWGGTVFSEAEFRAGIPRWRSVGVIGEGLYIGSYPDAPDNPDEFMNHSCDPNLWMIDEVTLVARRDIGPGEEATADYALWESDPAWKMPCLCGVSRCRGVISGDDWRQPSLQRLYDGHYSPYLLERISRLRGPL